MQAQSLLVSRRPKASRSVMPVSVARRPRMSMVSSPKVRSLETLGLAELPSTRLLVDAALLIRSGLGPRAACRAGVVEPLTDDPDVRDGLMDLVNLVF